MRLTYLNDRLLVFSGYEGEPRTKIDLLWLVALFWRMANKSLPKSTFCIGIHKITTVRMTLAFYSTHIFVCLTVCLLALIMRFRRSGIRVNHVCSSVQGHWLLFWVFFDCIFVVRLCLYMVHYGRIDDWIVSWIWDSTSATHCSSAVYVDTWTFTPIAISYLHAMRLVRLHLLDEEWIFQNLHWQLWTRWQGGAYMQLNEGRRKEKM